MSPRCASLTVLVFGEVELDNVVRVSTGHGEVSSFSLAETVDVQKEDVERRGEMWGPGC